MHTYVEPSIGSRGASRAAKVVYLFRLAAYPSLLVPTVGIIPVWDFGSTHLTWESYFRQHPSSGLSRELKQRIARLELLDFQVWPPGYGTRISADPSGLVVFPRVPSTTFETTTNVGRGRDMPLCNGHNALSFN